GLLPERPPDLSDEGCNRGLAAGAGDGDDGFRLAREEARGGVSEGGARVGDPDEGDAADRRIALGDNGRGASRQGVTGMSEAVVLRPGEGEKHVPRLHLAAVERDSADLARRERGVRVL